MYVLKQPLAKAIVGIFRIVGLYLFLLVVAAALAPFAYQLFQSLIPNSFERYFDRMRYIGLIIFMPVLWGWTGHASFKAIGWGRWRSGVGLLLLGALSTAAVSAYCAHVVGGVQWPALPALLAMLAFGLVSGLGVAFIEEPLFRGLLQPVLTRSCGVLLGVLLMSLFFALLHGRPVADITAPYSHADSWALAVSNFLNIGTGLTPLMIINLTLLGVALGLLYVRSGSLYTAIGLHAGIVAVAAPTTALLRQASAGVPATYMVGTWPTTVLLLFWVLLAALWPWRQGSPTASPQSRS